MKPSTTAFTITLLSGLLAANSFAGDWNQWRGPDRNGVASDGVALSKNWPSTELPKLWESADKIPADHGYGFSSPIIAGGDVFVFVSWKHSDPVPALVLDEPGLYRLGWNPTKLPEALAQKVDAARLSDERVKLQSDQVEAWINQWVTANLPGDLNDATKKSYSDILSMRLRRGKGVLDLAIIDKLVTIKDRKFSTQQDLDKWFDENSIPADARKPITGSIPTTVDTVNDTIVCISGSNGKTAWKSVLKKDSPRPLAFGSWGTSGTPCVSDGKVYVNGMDGAYCLDAKDGHQIWQNDVAGNDSSPLVVNGVVVVQSTFKKKEANAANVVETKDIRELRGLNAADGKELWVQPSAGCDHSSPVAWQDGEETRLLCNDGQHLSCVSIKDGSILWSVAGNGSSTPAIGDGYVVMKGEKPTVGMCAYKLGKIAPEIAWTLPISDRGSSPVVYKGHVYAQGTDRVVCAELATGKVTWEQKLPLDGYSSPSIAGGLLFITNNRLVILDANSADGKVLAKLKLPQLRCSSAAIADGKLVMRANDQIVCYDLVNIPAESAQAAASAK